MLKPKPKRQCTNGLLATLTNYLNGVVEARTLLGAVRAGRKYVEDELGGEGEIRIWESIDGGRTWKLVRTDEKGILSMTGWAVRHE